MKRMDNVELLHCEKWIAGPVWTHDCTDCKYLKTFHEDGKPNFDLYYCPQTALGPTLVARFSSNGPDYMSGLHSLAIMKMIRPLHLAHILAVEAGHIEKEAADAEEGDPETKEE